MTCYIRLYYDMVVGLAAYYVPTFISADISVYLYSFAPFFL
jgi:hypothetical protein